MKIQQSLDILSNHHISPLLKFSELENDSVQKSNKTANTNAKSAVYIIHNFNGDRQNTAKS